MRGAGHVEEKPVAAPTKCLAACPQHTLFVERPAMSLGTRKLGPTQRSSRVPEKRRISVNSTNALPCFGFFGCDCGHFGRSADRVARLLVNFGFCRIRFWYLVAAGSGISRKLSRIYFWNLTIDRLVGCYCLPNSYSCYSWCDYNSVLRTFYIHQHRPTGLTAAL